MLTGTLQKTNPIGHYFADEAAFRNLFPYPIQKLDALHWSPLEVTCKAVRYLAPDGGVKILDIGSGVGKFCLAGAFFRPAAMYFGVEQREHLVWQACLVRDRLGLANVQFVHSNFTQLDLREYDHFYFYNSFFENLSHKERIDDSIAYSRELYDYYSNYLNRQFDELPSGTRIVTYCSWGDEIPDSYLLLASDFEGLLKCWKKR